MSVRRAGEGPQAGGAKTQYPVTPMTRDLSNLDWAMDLSHVAKVYRGKVHALRGVGMRVRRGEIFGLLGPNGAGKSTLVKILMTVIRPTRAEGTVLDHPVGHKATLRRVGYLPEHHKFPDYLTGAQVVEFYAALAGVGRRERQRRRDELLDVVGMREWAGIKVKGYSKGMRQRVGIAQAIVNDPDLVVLDEPTDGVDPVGRRDIRAILVRLKEQGKTVFLNSHLLSELEMVCDRVAILVQGRVATQGTIDDLTREKRYYEIEITADSPGAASQHLRAALPEGSTVAPAAKAADLTAGDAPARGPAPEWQVLRGTLSGGATVEIDRSSVRIGTDDPAVAMPMVDALRARGIVIRALRLVRPSLEDLFMEAVTDPRTGRTLLPGAERPGGKSP